MADKLLYKKRVDLPLFRYGLVVPQKLHKQFFNKRILRGESITGFLIHNEVKYPIRISNADSVGRKNDTIRILYQTSKLSELIKELFPNNYKLLLDKVSGKSTKIKIPDDKADHLYIYSTCQPCQYKISNQTITSNHKSKTTRNPNVA